MAIEAMRVAGMEDATEAEKETAKNALKAFNEANDALKASVLNRRKLIIDNRVQEVQEATDAREEANKKAEEAEKKHNEQLLANQKKANQERIDEFLRLKRAETDIANQAALDREKADTAFFDKEMEARKNNELSKMTEQEADLERVRLKYEADLAYAEQNGLDASALLESQENEVNEINLKYQGIDYANKKANADAKIKIGEEEKLAQMAQMGAVSNALDGLSRIAGEKTAAGKALAIAAATINTYKGISEVWGAKSMGNPVVDMAVKIASTAIVAAQGIANVKKIMSVKVPGGGGGGGGAAPSGGGAPAPPPQFNIVGQSSTNQLSQTIAGQQNRPIQTYVVGNQVSTQQSLDRNAVATSTFG
jgi:hypothetical protein